MGVDISGLVGVEADDDAIQAVVRALVDAGYLAVHFESAAGIQMVSPTPKTLELEAGWPSSSAQAAVDELVVALDAEISATPDPERRSKLLSVRDGLVGAARDVAIAWAEKKMLGL
jgi:hypothetical protein